MAMFRRLVLLAVSGAALSAMLACDRRPPPGQPVQVSAEQMVREVKEAPVFADRLSNAADLAKLPAEQLKPFVPDLTAAYKAEKDPRVKKAIKAVLEKAK